MVRTVMSLLVVGGSCERVSVSGDTVLRILSSRLPRGHGRRNAGATGASIAFLGGNTSITEQPGRLRIRPERQAPSTARGPRPSGASLWPGRILEVTPHPELASNRMLYLTFSKPSADGSRPSPPSSAAASRTIG